MRNPETGNYGATWPSGIVCHFPLPVTELDLCPAPSQNSCVFKHVFQPRFWIFLPPLHLSHLCRVFTGIAPHGVPGRCIPPAKGLRAHPHRPQHRSGLPLLKHRLQSLNSNFTGGIKQERRLFSNYLLHRSVYYTAIKTPGAEKSLGDGGGASAASSPLLGSRLTPASPL